MKRRRYYTEFAGSRETFQHPFSPPFESRSWRIVTDTLQDDFTEETVLVVETSDTDRAQYVSDMIYAALCLMNAGLPSFDFPQVQEDNPKSFIYIPNAFFACEIARRASRRYVYAYALFKHLLSHEIMPNDPHEFSPSRRPRKFVYSFLHHYHLRVAYAIILAYAAIEELGLELRASREHPSTINKKKNPKVFTDLRKRLQKAGVHPQESVLWILPPSPTRIEKTLRGKSHDVHAAIAPWNRKGVRDRWIPVEDAIMYASLLRSKISSHRIWKKDASSLSLTVADARNVQDLARFLILKRLKLFKFLT